MTSKTRMPVHYLPPLPEVRELDEHGNDIAEPKPASNQWAEKLQIQANNPPLSERNWTHDNKPKPVIEVYEWPEFTE